MDTMSPDAARVARVNGPLVEVSGLADAAMYDVVELGEHRLPGEIIAIRGDVATIQAYEYTGGLAPGHPARSRGEPLSARLGPHLLGGIFDGLLRPLSGAPAWLGPGCSFAGAAAEEYEFIPETKARAALDEGASLGTVTVSGGIRYRVLVPPGLSGVVEKVREAGLVPGDAVIATVSGTDVRMTSAWPVRRPRPYRRRLEAGPPLLTGQRVVDVLFPVTKGGSCAVPGGFGTGKTVLLQQITKWCDADVIVYVGCGERGNELADMLSELADLGDPRGGGKLSARTVVIANTSNMPMMAREASIYSAACVAEHFRDMGLDVVVVADSTSRWAEALREFASRNGELPAEEGYPASLASALAAFYERAGRVRTSGGSEGSVTIIGAVSPAGGDMTEPVTAYTQRFVRGLWTLDRDLAYARHYPAVSWSGSFSRDVAVVAAWHTAAGDAGWAERRSRLATLLAEADRITSLAELMGVAALPPRERATLVAGRLIREGLLQQSALSPVDASCGTVRAAALAGAVLLVAERCLQLAGSGVPPAAIEDRDFAPILRAREEATTPEAVTARARDVLGRLDELSRADLDELSQAGQGGGTA
ncbi:MAG TPA: V-type ATP synthase subunit A [Streptosporangiaceae bacterium]|nr:V-type ATP synthase subunit A [Streptosporangiaceae bacterium]